jgi:ABC-type transport system substrate-binding protein
MLPPFLQQTPSLYRDGEIEGLLDRALSLRDQAERLRMYREVERIWIGEHVALVPLVYNRSVMYRRPWVTGIWKNALVGSTFAEAVVRR